MKELTEQQAETLIAFLDSFDLALTGVWPAVEKHMRDSYGIEDPESALEDARNALQ